MVDSVLNIRDLMIINALPTNTHTTAVTFTAYVLYGLGMVLSISNELLPHLNLKTTLGATYCYTLHFTAQKI